MRSPEAPAIHNTVMHNTIGEGAQVGVVGVVNTGEGGLHIHMNRGERGVHMSTETDDSPAPYEGPLEDTEPEASTSWVGDNESVAFQGLNYGKIYVNGKEYRGPSRESNDTPQAADGDEYTEEAASGSEGIVAPEAPATQEAEPAAFLEEALHETLQQSSEQRERARRDGASILELIELLRAVNDNLTHPSLTPRISTVHLGTPRPFHADGESIPPRHQAGSRPHEQRNEREHKPRTLRQKLGRLGLTLFYGIRATRKANKATARRRNY